MSPWSICISLIKHMYFNKWGASDGCFCILILINIRKASVHWLMNIGVLDFMVCWTLITPELRDSMRGSSSWWDSSTLKSKNSLDQILAFIFCDTVAPRGIPSDNEMTWLELTQSLVVPTGSPAVFSKSCVITEAIWFSCVVSFLVWVTDASS